MRAALHIGPLYRLDGKRPARAGIGFYTDSLLAALRETTPDGAEITAFAPLASRHCLEEMGREGVFSWWPPQGSPPRLDTANTANLLERFLPARDENALSFRAKRRLGLFGARRAVRRYDVLHLPAPFSLPPEKYAPQAVVVTLYDMTVRTFPRMHESGNVRAWEAFHDFALARQARVITISEAARQDIVTHLELPPERVTVTPLAPRRSVRHIPPGSERDALLHAIPGWRDGPFVLYAGTLEPRKNWERLVRAFAQVRKETPALREHRLVLAGGAWKGQAARLQEVIAETAAGDAVLWPGYVSDDAMSALMSACEAFVYPSLGEGFGLPPLEAMACGAPVITSNAPINTDAIAAALFCLLTDSEENRRYRTKAVERARQFSWERTARLTWDVYMDAARGAS
jgi:glycosyltransferase involved in cell wall biosynthesis